MKRERRAAARSEPDRLVVIAGGTGSLARAPRPLAATGLRFVLIGRNAERARESEAAFRAAGAEAWGVGGDVLREGDLGRAISEGCELAGSGPGAVVWNVGFVPWPAPGGFDSALAARVARDEARSLAELAGAVLPYWRGGDGLVVTLEGHRDERLAGAVPVLELASALRAAMLAALKREVPGLLRGRVLLGALPSGPTGEGRWLSPDEIASAVGDALVRRVDRVVAGDLELAARLAERYRTA